MRLELIQPIFGDSASRLGLRSDSPIGWSKHNGGKPREHLRYDVQDVALAVETIQTELGLVVEHAVRAAMKRSEERKRAAKLEDIRDSSRIHR